MSFVVKFLLPVLAVVSAVLWYSALGVIRLLPALLFHWRVIAWTSGLLTLSMSVVFCKVILWYFLGKCVDVLWLTLVTMTLLFTDLVKMIMDLSFAWEKLLGDWLKVTPPAPYWGPAVNPWYSPAMRVPPGLERDWWVRLMVLVKPYLEKDLATMLGYSVMAAVALKILYHLLVVLVKLVAKLARMIKTILVYSKRSAEQHSFYLKYVFQAEKMIPGNPLTPSLRPKSQCDVYIRCEDTEFTYSGQGFRVGDFVYTAAHVIESADGLRFVTDKGYVEVFDMKRATRADSDIARILLTPQEWGKLQMKTVKFSEVVNGKVLASCYARGVKSIGFVEPYDAFGYVLYNGSTQPGHSGAPYIINNCVVGMHLGGHEQNIGYDGQYLRMIHSKFVEDSEDFMWKQIEKGYIKSMEVRTLASMDEYEVKAGGRYYQVDGQDLARMRKQGITIRPVKGGQLDMELETGKIVYDEKIPVADFQFQVDDCELSSKNLLEAPADAGALGELNQQQGSVQPLSPPISSSMELCQPHIDRASSRLISTLVQLRNHLETTYPDAIECREKASMACTMLTRLLKREIRQLLDSLHGVFQS